MSLQTVAEDIRDEARARAQEIRAEGEQRAEEIVAEAEEDAEEIVEERRRSVETQIERERDQAISSANLEAKQQRLEARRDALEDAREEVEAEIAAMGGAEREELTRALLDAAAAEFDDEDEVAVYGRADDEALLAGILADYDGFRFAGERDCLGGVIVEGRTSRVRVNNTFDSVLEDVWDENLKELSTILFDEQ